MFNILVEFTCKGGRVVNAEAYGGADLDEYMAQRGFTDHIGGAVHPTYRHSNGLTAIAVVAAFAKFDFSQQITAMIRRIGVAATDVKAAKRGTPRTRRTTGKADAIIRDAYLEGILAKCES